MYKQVIVVRSDLEMGKGKIAAQASHASVAVLDKIDKKIVSAWKEGGQKKVVVKVKSLDEILEIKKECDRARLPNVLINDGGHTQLKPGTTTALGIGPDKEEKIDKVTGHLKLL